MGELLVDLYGNGQGGVKDQQFFQECYVFFGLCGSVYYCQVDCVSECVVQIVQVVGEQ